MGLSKSESTQRSGSQQTSFSQQQQAAASRQFVDPRQVPFLDFLRGQATGVVNQQLGQLPGVADQLSGQLGGIGGELLGGLQAGAQADPAGGAIANLQAGAQAGPPGAGTAISSLLGISGPQGGVPGPQSVIEQLLGLSGGADAAALRGAATGPLAGAAELQAIAAGQAGGGGLDFQSLLEPGAQITGQLDALDAALQRNLASTLGTIGGQATLAGQTGGGRQAFLSSQAAGRAQEAFAGGAADILASDLSSRRALAGTAAGFELTQQGQSQQAQLAAAQALQAGALGQAGQQGANLASLLQGSLGGAQAAGQLGLGAAEAGGQLSLAQRQQQLGAAEAAGQLGLAGQGQRLGAGEAGLSQLQNLFNLGLSPFAAQLQPLLALADILGGPTVLGESLSRGTTTSRSQGTSFGRGDASSFSFQGA